MKYEMEIKNGFHILHMREDVGGTTDLDAFKELIRGLLDKGMKNLAIEFTPNSYFCSLTLSVLVQFLGFVKEREGELVILRPNERIANTLQIVGLHKLIKMANAETDLPGGE
jgi:anti-anti-sigma factor